MTATEPLPDDSLTILNAGTAEFPAIADDDSEDEFLPRTRTRRHWLTSALIYLVVWGGGFLVGVLVDRVLAGALG